jgi:hypothetical protein
MQPELSFFKAVNEELEQYLLSSQLYWHLSGMTQDNTLTPGNILLNKTRICGKVLPAGDQAEFSNLRDQIENSIKRWRTHWEQKAILEFDSRLRTWGNYLSDLQEDEGVKSAQFRSEVKNRVILQLLMQHTGRKIDPMSKEHLAILDAQLKSSSIAGNFLWDAELENVFPQSDFWFLYISFEKG